jgi:hypothetical protein
MSLSMDIDSQKVAQHILCIMKECVNIPNVPNVLATAKGALHMRDKLS